GGSNQAWRLFLPEESAVALLFLVFRLSAPGRPVVSPPPSQNSAQAWEFSFCQFSQKNSGFLVFLELSVAHLLGSRRYVNRRCEDTQQRLFRVVEMARESDTFHRRCRWKYRNNSSIVW